MRYAIKDAGGATVNVIEWDGVTPLTLQDGCTAVAEAAPVPANTALSIGQHRVAIEIQRDAALAGVVTWNGRDWHLDPTFQLHLTGFITAFDAGILPPGATVAIRTADAATVQLGLVELKALAGAVMTKVQQIWADSWAAKDALA